VPASHLHERKQLRALACVIKKNRGVPSSAIRGVRNGLMSLPVKVLEFYKQRAGIIIRIVFEGAACRAGLALHSECGQGHSTTRIDAS
jgi:hypothetical protein